MVPVGEATGRRRGHHEVNLRIKICPLGYIRTNDSSPNKKTKVKDRGGHGKEACNAPSAQA